MKYSSAIPDDIHEAQGLANSKGSLRIEICPLDWRSAESIPFGVRELAAVIAPEIKPLCAIVSDAQAAQRMLSADTPDVGEVRDTLRDIAYDSQRANETVTHVRGMLQKESSNLLNDLDRFHLCEDVIDRLPQLGARAAYFKQAIHEKLIEHQQYIEEYGDDMPAISGWKWGDKSATATHGTSTEGDNV
jgi:hypothetical protein